MSQAKQAALRMIEALPEDCTYEDILYHLYVQEKIARGLADAEAGRIVSQEEAERRIRECVK